MNKSKTVNNDNNKSSINSFFCVNERHKNIRHVIKFYSQETLKNTFKIVPKKKIKKKSTNYNYTFLSIYFTTEKNTKYIHLYDYLKYYDYEKAIAFYTRKSKVYLPKTLYEIIQSFCIKKFPNETYITITKSVFLPLNVSKLITKNIKKQSLENKDHINKKNSKIEYKILIGKYKYIPHNQFIRNKMRIFGKKVKLLDKNFYHHLIFSCCNLESINSVNSSFIINNNQNLYTYHLRIKSSKYNYRLISPILKEHLVSMGFI